MLRSHGPRPAGLSEVLASLLLENGMDPENLGGGLDERAALWRSQMADRRALLLIVLRLLDYFLTVADRADRLARPARRRMDIRPATPPPALPVLADADDGGSWLDTERANLLAAADAAALLPTAHAGLFPHVLARAFDAWGIWNVAIRLSDAALATWRRRGDAAAEALCLVEQASALWNQGRHEDALRCAEQALTVSRATGDRWVQAEALTAMGRAHHIAGRRGEGDRCLDEALALHRAVGNRRGEAEALNVRGVPLALDGEHAAAQHFRAVLDIEKKSAIDTARSRRSTTSARCTVSGDDTATPCTTTGRHWP